MHVRCTHATNAIGDRAQEGNKCIILFLFPRNQRRVGPTAGAARRGDAKGRPGV